MAAGMFSGTVQSGSLTRSAAGAEAGTKTPLVNVFSGVFMLVGILLLGRFISYIPLPALSAVIIAIAVPLFSRKALRLALKSTRADRAVFLLTFFTGMIWSLDDAVYVGVCASIILFLQKASSPEVVEVAIGDDGEERKVTDESPRAIPEISIVHVGGNLFFGASDVFQDQIRRITEEPNLKVILLKLRNAINFDATSASDIEEIAQQMKSRGGVLLLSEVSPAIMRILKKSGVARNVGEDNIFPSTEDNPTLSAALALRQAKKILGDQQSDVKIYV
jgi:SulP family sulfate permease